jgi:hypothetical protein
MKSPPRSSPNVADEPLPDFTEADFFKYLRRHDAVATRIEWGDLPRSLLAEFHRKLGGTPRFVEQASAVLAQIDPDALRDQLEGDADPPDDADPGVDDVNPPRVLPGFLGREGFVERPLGVRVQVVADESDSRRLRVSGVQ